MIIIIYLSADVYTILFVQISCWLGGSGWCLLYKDYDTLLPKSSLLQVLD